MPGRVASQRPSVAQPTHLGIAREQPRDERALALAGAGVDDLAGRLVNDHEFRVVEDDRRPRRAVGARPCRSGVAEVTPPGAGRPRASVEGF